MKYKWLVVGIALILFLKGSDLGNAGILPNPQSPSSFSEASSTLVKVFMRINAGTSPPPIFTNYLIRPYIDSTGRQVVVGYVDEAILPQLELDDSLGLIRLTNSPLSPPNPDPEFDFPPPNPNELAKRLANMPNPPQNQRSIPPQVDWTAIANNRGWWDVRDGHQSRAAWQNGFTGNGIRLFTNDSGIDFCHPDLIGTWQTVTDVGSPYFGMPQMFDSYSMYLYAEDVHLGSSNVADGLADYADTSATCTLGSCSYQPIGSATAHNYTLPATSQSGVYHIGSHPDTALAGIYGGERVAVLVVDETTANNYESVYVDLDNDYDFTDEMPATPAIPIACLDNYKSFTGLPGSDGYNDISGGLVYFVADGVLPIPASDWLWGGLVPTNGDLVAFTIADLNGEGRDHGQAVTANMVAQGVSNGRASSLQPPYLGVGDGSTVGGAPNAKVTSGGNTYETPFVEDAFLFAALGYDGVAYTGDDAQIIVNSWANESVEAEGWEEDSRLIEEVLRQNNLLTAIFSSGNGGAGYGTSGAPYPVSAMKVGASTQFGNLDVFDSITSTAQIEWGHVTSFSGRGPGAMGDNGVDILANGDAGTGLEALQFRLDGWMATSRWRGTSRSVPVVAANLALVYEAYWQAHGVLPTAVVAQAILKAGAIDTHNDPFVQGAGYVNALAATNIANGLAGFYVMPDEWVAGDYAGISAPSFPNLLYPGDSDSQTITFYNDTPNSIDLNLTSDQLTEISFLTIPFTSKDSVLEDANGFEGRPDYLIDLAGMIPPNTDLMQVELVYPITQFDFDNNLTRDNVFRLKLLNWTDVNEDGNLWVDNNVDGIVNTGEIDDFEYMRFTHDYADTNTMVARVSDPLGNMTDGVFIALNHRFRNANVPVTNMTIKVTFYEHAPWSWLTVSPPLLTIPPNSTAVATATLTVPPNAPIGLYGGAIVAKRMGGQRSIVPVVANIAGISHTLTLGGTPPSDTLYDNGSVSGHFNWAYREDAGDWRFFFVDMPLYPAPYTPHSAAALLHSTWDDTAPTDIDTHVFAPSPDPFTQLDPAYFGNHGLKEVASSTDTYQGNGKWLFDTTTGTTNEWLTFPITEGLHLFAQHNVLNAGNSPAIPFTVTIGTLATNPNPITLDSCANNGSAPLTLTNTIALDGMAGTGYGLSQPAYLAGTLHQDDPMNGATASFSQTITIADGGLIAATMLDVSDAIHDAELYLLFDANSDSQFDWTDAAELVAKGDNIYYPRPADGDYLVAVYGKDVDDAGTFLLKLTAIQGTTNLTIPDLPFGAVPPTTSHMTLNWNQVLNDGEYYEGVVFMGEMAVPEVVSVDISLGLAGVLAGWNAGNFLMWQPIPNATNYHIYQHTTAPYFTPVTPHASTPLNQYSDPTHFTDADNHYYVVHASNACTESRHLKRQGIFKFDIEPGA